MNKLMDWYRNTVVLNTNNQLHPVEIAVTLFFKLLKIQPFNYENELIAKLILNLELLKNGYPIAIIEKKNKALFNRVTEVAIYNDDIESIENIIVTAITKSLKLYIKALSNYSGENYTVSRKPRNV